MILKSLSNFTDNSNSPEELSDSTALVNIP